MPLSPDESKRVALAIEAKTNGAPCPRCQQRQFAIGGYSYVHAKSDPTDYEVSGQVVGTVTVVCGNCGFVMEHARDPLGL